MNSSSAYLNPSFRAVSGWVGNWSYEAINKCKLSLRNSAQPEPPCPSKTAKKDTFLVYTFPAAPGFFKSRTIETLSSLYPRAIPLWVLAAYAWIAPQGFYDILEGNIFGTLLFPFNILRSAGFARLEIVAEFLVLAYRGLFFMISIAD